MTETNSDPVVDDDKPVTEEDLRDLKYGEDGVETPKGEDEPDEAAEESEESEEASEEVETDDQADEEEDSSDPPSFVKEFPHIKGDTPEEYARNLEIAYGHSFGELKRIREEAKAPETTKKVPEGEDEDSSDPLALWAKQKLDEEINDAFTDFKKTYPQVEEDTAYAKFVNEVTILSQTIQNSQKRLAPPKELYAKAAVILGWEPEGKVDSKDKLDMALKDKASSSKSSSAPKSAPSKSKVTDQMVAVNRMMYPGKTDTEIRKELEPYV